jgi:CubicO group peptidase (beta-lactamase class C family)
VSDFQDLVIRRLEDTIGTGVMSAASVRIDQRGETLLEWTGGKRDFGPSAPPADTDSVYYIASVSKPMSTTGFANLIERGLVDADDPVAEYVPEFDGNGKAGVTLRHCLTHTSGLSDMVPGNIGLRKRNAPRSEFVAAACESRLLFPPGTDVRYQSSGILMLSEVSERVTGIPYRDHLAQTLFKPTGMTSTQLGWRNEFEDRIVVARVDDPENTAHWNTNSEYWRNFGAPWGGVHTTAADVARLMQLMLDGGRTPSGDNVLNSGTVRMLLHDYTTAGPDLSTATRLREGWGFGWRLQRLGAGGWFGSAVPPSAFGHHGVSGTVAWADPASGVVFVLLTNGQLEARGETLKACGNIAATALCAAD